MKKNNCLDMDIENKVNAGRMSSPQVESNAETESETNAASVSVSGIMV